MLNRLQRGLATRRDKFIRKALGTCLSPVPLWMWQKIDQTKIHGWFYHLVSPQQKPHVATYPYKTPEQFKNDLLYLKKNFRLLNYSELKSAVVSGERLDSACAFVSFDDGMRECLEYAIPILSELKVPAIFFLNSDFLDNKKMFYRHKASLCMTQARMLKKPQIEVLLKELNRAFQLDLSSAESICQWLYALNFEDESKIDGACSLMQIDWMAYLKNVKPYLTTGEVQLMVKNGFDIGAHTRDHKLLSLLKPEQITTEIVSSCSDISQLIGSSSVPFAFPFHGRGIASSVLEKIRNENSVVDLMFEATGIGLKEPRIVNRIWADPPPSKGASTNLPQLLQKEYVNQIY
jgi:peptidoglycan/xylan/chitin deacetylase (PgdA/CDA1 family)